MCFLWQLLFDNAIAFENGTQFHTFYDLRMQLVRLLTCYLCRIHQNDAAILLFDEKKFPVCSAEPIAEKIYLAFLLPVPFEIFFIMFSGIILFKRPLINDNHKCVLTLSCVSNEQHFFLDRKFSKNDTSFYYTWETIEKWLKACKWAKKLVEIQITEFNVHFTAAHLINCLL